MCHTSFHILCAQVELRTGDVVPKTNQQILKENGFVHPLSADKYSYLSGNKTKDENFFQCFKWRL